MTIFTAIFKTLKRDDFLIQYIPLEDGFIDIVSVDVRPRPRSDWEQRREDRRTHGGMKRRGLVLDEQEQRAEAMQPYTRLENAGISRRRNG